MAPKKQDKAAQKAAADKREKVAQDKTFGLKNKNKSKVVQAKVNQIQNSAKNANNNNQRPKNEYEEKRAHHGEIDPDRILEILRKFMPELFMHEDVEIEVQNMVATYALHYPVDYDGKDKFTGEPLADAPRKLNLNHLTFHLPFDKVEYEPEQFPGLIYRLDYPKVVCLIFGSGKMVITGARHKDEILEAVEIIKDELADLL